MQGNGDIKSVRHDPYPLVAKSRFISELQWGPLRIRRF